MTHMEKVYPMSGLAKEGGNLLTGARGLRRWLALYAATLMQLETMPWVCQEEIFGPFGVSDICQLTGRALANDTSFGLVSYVWSENLSTIMDAQKRLESAWVNTPMVRELRAPFGGVKDSESAESGKPASSSTRRRKPSPCQFKANAYKTRQA